MTFIQRAAFLVGMLAIFFYATPTWAAGSCLCVKPDGTAACVNVPANRCDDTLPKKDAATYSMYKSCRPINAAGGETADATCTKMADDITKDAVAKTKAQSSGGSSSYLLDFDDCVKASTVTGECRDVTIFIRLLFRITDWVFGVIGALALVMFIYGGFTFILSQGNAERVTQGKAVLTSAVIGLIIAFGGYVLVKFVAQTIGVSSEYILK